MEHIANLIPRAIETLEQPTPVAPANTKVQVKFPKFETLGDEQLERMKAAAIAFTLEMLAGNRPRWLSLLGTSGAGKTMLARMITHVFNRCIKGKIESETTERIVQFHGGFIAWSTLTEWLREGQFRDFSDVCGHQFVALDDIGSEYATPFTTAKLYDFFARRERKWTVITGNLSLEQVAERLDARIASRMIRHGSVVVDVDVVDFNLRQ